jgi:choline dehydrogenase-like flavoprotein
MKTNTNIAANAEPGIQSEDFAERVRVNQAKLTFELRPHYDFIVCGSGSSGSVVARRLAENPDVSVLLLEAGGSDDVPSVMEAGQWPLNLGSDQDWAFQAQPNPNLNGRSIPMNMGKVLGGGSSINVMCWARGHKNDWDYFASEAGDPAWSYESVLKIYGRIEDWHGAPDPKYRGTGGPVFVQPAPDPNPIAPAMLKGARSVGIPTFENQNGRMMEGAGGCSIMDVRIRDGKRQSVFRSYTFPYMDRPNLTVLAHALVTRITFEGKRATGVVCDCAGKTQRIGARLEVVLSLGAISYAEGADAIRHRRPGRVTASRNPSGAASSRRGAELSGPRRYWLRLGVPEAACAMQQRGRGNFLLEERSESREIGNSDAFRPFVKREVMPGNLKGAELENFIRDSVVTYWHETCTAKMGRDAMSVVDANLKVYGIENLRIADGSTMPRVATGNTMAPCVIIGERAGEILKASHKI